MKNDFLFVTRSRAWAAAAALAVVVMAPPAAEAKPWCYRNAAYAGVGDGYCHTRLTANTAGTTFKGYMIVVAAGGWTSSPWKVEQFERNESAWWRNLGYATYTVEHSAGYGGSLGDRQGGRAISDVKQHFDELRAALDRFGGAGPYTPICIYGWSSGGHVAQLAALNRPKINCVVVAETPFDLNAIQGEATRSLAARAFGLENFAVFSPINWPPNTHQRTFVGNTTNDPYIGWGQTLGFYNNRPAYVRGVLLDAGTTGFAHGTASPNAILRWWSAAGNFAPRGTW